MFIYWGVFAQNSVIGHQHWALCSSLFKFENVQLYEIPLISRYRFLKCDTAQILWTSTVCFFFIFCHPPIHIHDAVSHTFQPHMPSQKFLSYCSNVSISYNHKPQNQPICNLSVSNSFLFFFLRQYLCHFCPALIHV